MNLDHVFKKTLVRPFAGIRKKPEVPEGLLCKCSMCKKAIVAEDVRKNFYVCPSCNGYFRVRAQERIARIADEGSFLEWDQDLVGKNPMEFEGYEEKIAAARLKTRLKEAVVTGQCTIGGEPCVLCVMDGRFMMASMGEAVGEKITRAAEEATKKKLPIIIFTCSGGARMQEGIISLMQMAKTSAALKRHSDEGLLYISVLTDPTTGGVTASFAMEADIILAEPKALIGFAGPRVIEQTIRQKLPKYVNASPFDIQVLTPMRKGLLGVERLNTILQQYLNPPDGKKAEREHGQTIFRVGDKVMQIKNNYQAEWEIRSRYNIPIEKGLGVFNGDMGIVREINSFSETLTVEYEERRMVEYPFKELDQLDLAYAITIHKSQGSEYPAVIIPLLTGPRMLMNRNLLYTAVTRARKCVTLVGDEKAFYNMEANVNEQKRYSGLRDRLEEL